MSKAKSESKATVLVTTSHRGVFWGTIESTRDNGRTIVLTGARNAIYWATSKGFLELAQIGPNKASKVGATAPRITLHDVTSVTECTDEAAKAWESFG
jgi:hypothetical protein